MQRLCFLAAVAFVAATSSGCPRGDQADAGTCTPGEVGCDCTDGVGCAEGLICTSGVCQECTSTTPGCGPDSQAGSEGCTCGPDGICGAGLVCQGGLCVSGQTCSEGAQSCLCGPDGSCDAGLACVDGTCQPCSAETCPVTCDGGSCETRVTCSTLPEPCPAGHSCVEATETTDAYCAQDLCPACSGEGVVDGPGLRTASGSCICTTDPGYFYSESGSRGPVQCDADGDGWVRTAARFYLNHSDPVLRENARCNLRVINQFVLHNDRAQTLSVGLTAPLPLYETVRNDDQYLLEQSSGMAQLPLYGTTRSLRAAEINSLTKACAGPLGDHNDNKVSDVSEWGRPPYQQIAIGSSSEIDGEMAGYFEAYTRFSYFLELHRGWFIQGADGAPGSYHVEEKDRTILSGTTFPLRYGLEPGGTVQTSNYWQDCRRARDAWYSEETPPIGMDFASVSQPAHFWKGMTHHSQFKCVQVVDDATYASINTSLYRHLQTVTTLSDPVAAPALSGCDGQLNCACRATAPECDGSLSCEGGVCRIPTRDYLRAAVNRCEVSTAEGTLIGDGSPNPLDPTFTCTVSQPSSDHLGKVVWAAVRITDSSRYARGCILQCAGHPFLCPGGDGTACRTMCADLAITEVQPLTAPNMTLKGEVPYLPTTDRFLGSGDGTGFTIRAP